MAELTVLDANAATEVVLEHLERDGGVIVRDLLSRTTIDRFQSDIEETAASHKPGATTGGERTVEFWGGQTKRFTRLAWRSPAFEEILLAPMLTAVSDEVLLPSCDDYWLNTGQMMIIGPGESEQMPHRTRTTVPHASCPEVTDGATTHRKPPRIRSRSQRCNPATA